MFLKQKKYISLVINKLVRYDHINEALFVTLVFLCFIGDLLAEISGHFAVFYWFTMIPLFYFITQLNEQAKEIKTGVSIEHFSRFNLIYWCSAFTAILLVLMLWHSNDLDAQGSALAIHIIVAHTMFLLGILGGLRFYLIGSFLFLTAAVTIFMEGIVGITLLVLIPVLYFGFRFEKHKKIPTISNFKTQTTAEN